MQCSQSWLACRHIILTCFTCWPEMARSHFFLSVAMHAPTGGQLPPVTTCLCRDLHPVMSRALHAEEGLSRTWSSCRQSARVAAQDMLGVLQYARLLVLAQVPHSPPLKHRHGGAAW